MEKRDDHGKIRNCHGQINDFVKSVGTLIEAVGPPGRTGPAHYRKPRASPGEIERQERPI